MPLTISGSTGIAGVDGSASTPAVQGTDTNTGIVFPAADTVTVATGGTERMRIDSSGNVGIGTSSPGTKLAVVGAISASGSITTSGQVLAATFSTAYLQAISTNNGGSTNIINDGVAGYIEVNGTSAIPMLFRTQGTERMRLENDGSFKFNSGYGSVATAYGCRAWVNFNGTGTVAIRGSGNVTSITDNGTGDYTVNFTNAMPDVNYSAVTAVSHAGGASRSTAAEVFGFYTGSLQIVAGYASSTYDPNNVCVAIFR